MVYEVWRKKISFGCGNKINCRMLLLNLKQLQISRQLGRTSRPVCTICGCSCATKCVRLSQLDPQKLREGDQGCSLHLWTTVWHIHVWHMYRYMYIYIHCIYILLHLATNFPSWKIPWKLCGISECDPPSHTAAAGPKQLACWRMPLLADAMYMENPCDSKDLTTKQRTQTNLQESDTCNSQPQRSLGSILHDTKIVEIVTATTNLGRAKKYPAIRNHRLWVHLIAGNKTSDVRRIDILSEPLEGHLKLIERSAEDKMMVQLQGCK